MLLIYDLLLIGTVITVGRLGDLFGRRRFYASGFLIFVLSSALCGIAQTAAQIILFRGLQAIGGAMISANGRAIASVAFPASQRGKAMGFASMAFHVGFLTGPTLGGFLIDTIGWRWIFFINLPIGIWGAYLALRLLEESKEEVKGVSVDFPGAILLMLTCSLFIFAMNEMPHVGWRDPLVSGTLILSALALALFVFVELRSAMPILSFSLFRIRLFTASMFSLFFITSTQSAISFLMPFYLQDVLRFSPTQMGWIIIANSAVIVLVAPIAGWLSDRMGSRLLCTIGSAIIVIGQFFIASLPIDASIWRIIAPLLLIGFGWAIFNSPEHDHGAHRRGDGRRAFSNFVYLWAQRGGHEPGANRIAAILGRRSGDFRSFVQSHGSCRQLLHDSLGVIFGGARPAPRNPTAIKRPDDCNGRASEITTKLQVDSVERVHRPNYCRPRSTRDYGRPADLDHDVPRRVYDHSMDDLGL